MQNFKDKVVVITGAGSGIGRELAYQFAAKDATLALNDWNESQLLETWEQLPESSRGLMSAFDVGDRAASENFASRCRKALGRVDVVINNAGMSVRQLPIIHSKVESYEEVLRVNLWGVIYSSLAFLPALREHPGSSLVNISSVFGLMGFPGSAPYNVSKFGVRGFTETLRVEMKDTPLHVACVHPGGIRTNIANNVVIENEQEKARFIKTFESQAPTTAQEAAATIIKGIEKKKSRILIGKDAYFIDRITRLLPASYERVLARWLKSDQFLRQR